MCVMCTFTCIIIIMQSPAVFGGVSEDEVEHYREVFADTGSHVQVHYYACIYNVL